MSTLTLVVLIWGSGPPALTTVPNFTMGSIASRRAKTYSGGKRAFSMSVSRRSRRWLVHRPPQARSGGQEPAQLQPRLS